MGTSRLRRMVTVAAAGLLLSGCTGSGGTGGAGKDSAPLQIGTLWPQSGPLKSDGDDTGRGWQLYLDTHGGRLGGHRVTVTTVDEGVDPQQAAKGVTRLLDEHKVLVVAGGVSGSAVARVQPIITARKVPMVGTVGRPSNLKDITYTWHTSWQSVEPGAAIADHLRATVDGPIWAMGPDFQGGWDQVNGFANAFTAAGGRLANDTGKPLFTPYPVTPTFQPYFDRIAASDAKAVYVFYAGALAIQFVKQYRQSGLKLPLYAAGFITEGAGILAAQGPAADGIRTVLNYAPDLDNPANRAFATAYQKKYGVPPTTFALTAYDAASILDRAIAAAGDRPTSESINNAIARLGSIDSPRGSWRFGTQHSPIQPWYLREVRIDGRGRGNVILQTLTTLGR